MWAFVKEICQVGGDQTSLLIKALSVHIQPGISLTAAR